MKEIDAESTKMLKIAISVTPQFLKAVELARQNPDINKNRSEMIEQAAWAHPIIANAARENGIKRPTTFRMPGGIHGGTRRVHIGG